MQVPPLSRGCFADIIRTPAKDRQEGRFVFQVIDSKLMGVKNQDPESEAKQRRAIKLALGDGVYLATAIYNTDMAAGIAKGAIVLITGFVFDYVAQRRMILILNMEQLSQYGLWEDPILLTDRNELTDVSTLLPPGVPAGTPQAAVAGQQPPPQIRQPPQQQQQQQAPVQGYGGYGAGTYGAGGPPPRQGVMPPQPQAGMSYRDAPPQGGSTYGYTPSAQDVPGGAGVPREGQVQAPGRPSAGASGGLYGGPPPSSNAASYTGGYGGGGPTPVTAGGGGGGNPYGMGGGNRPAPQYVGSGAVVRDEAAPRLVSIRGLSPYTTRWAIRARCTSKSDLRRYSSARGEGKLFSFDLLDHEGSDIRVTAFNQEAEKFYEIVQLGHIYVVQKASLVPKKPQFNNTSHAYEVKLDRQSVVEEVPEDAETRAIPSVVFNFRPILDVERAEAGSLIDVLGVVESCDAWQAITRRNGEETRKRSLTLRDDSGRSVEVSLWGNLVDDPGAALEQAVRMGRRPVAVFKALRVGDFNGKSLSTVGSSVVKIDPLPEEVPSAQQLRVWYEQGGAKAACHSLSGAGGGGGLGRPDTRVTFSTIKEEQLGTSGRAEYVTVAGTVDFVRADAASLVYPACPLEFSGRPCSKKMVDVGNGFWSCERCAANTAQPQWRYMASLSAADHTGRQWLTAFGDAGDAIFGASAERVHELELQRDAAEIGAAASDFQRMLEDAMMSPVVLRLKVAEETYNDETKLKVSIARAERVTDWAREGKIVLDYIRKLEQGVPVLTMAAAAAATATAAPRQQQALSPQRQQAPYGAWKGNQPGGATQATQGRGPTQAYGGGGGGNYGGAYGGGGGYGAVQQQQQRGGGAGGRTGYGGGGGAGYAKQGAPQQQPYRGGGGAGGYGDEPDWQQQQPQQYGSGAYGGGGGGRRSYEDGGF